MSCESLTTDCIIQGTTKTIIVECYQSDGVTPIDLSTASAITFGLKRKDGINSSSLLSKSLGSGVSIQNTNEAVVTIESSDTNSLIGKFEWTVTITDFSPDNNTGSKQGILIINPSATI